MSFQKRMPPAGSRPGTLAIPADSPPPRIRVFAYRDADWREEEVADPEVLRQTLDSGETVWVDVQGFGDEELLWSLARIFDLHPLTLEDATNVPQRAKSELHAAHQLLIARLPLEHPDGRLEVPQVCMILGPGWLLTFQDRHFGFFDPVRERIRAGIGPIRQKGAGYLAYALLDALVDRYFPIIEKLTIQLDEVEDRIDDEPEPEILAELHHIRRSLAVIRRIGWPQREALRTILIVRGPYFGEDVRIFLQSTEQHITQIMEAVDSAKDASSGLVDVYLSALSQRTNEIMKVLTLMASIFIPLTFIAGVYGMNFESMPELHEPWAYPLVLSTMVGTAAGMLLYFRRRGWLGRSRQRRGRS